MKNELAFPTSIAIGPEGDIYSSLDMGHPGLTKREYFAGLAMQGELAAQTDNRLISPFQAAALAVDCAEALLKELEKS